MKPRQNLDSEKKEALRRELHRDIARHNRGYRERALKLFPHVCASCGREFSGRRLRELTVHHRDHDHTNNPPDGSNWELLCIYCHDHEHEKLSRASQRKAAGPAADAGSFDVFADLDRLIKPPAASSE